MRKCEFDEQQTQTLFRAVNASLNYNLNRLSSARQRIKSAIDLGIEPDKRDTKAAQMNEDEIVRLRAIKQIMEEARECEV